eukprot:PhF_6_TR37547/c0_g1_i1/m.55613
MQHDNDNSCSPLVSMVLHRTVNSLLVHPKLFCDPEEKLFWPNKTAREVKSGFYVRCLPDPITSPDIVAISADMAATLCLGPPESLCKDTSFLHVMSGNLGPYKDQMESWATPYALSINGDAVDPSPDPFGTGNGYGDGRVISIGEFSSSASRCCWELQLKGAGPTPFCRHADGRAVLRSSVREFIASEAMHHLGIPTTRALSLVVSKDMKVSRGWYMANSSSRNTDVVTAEPVAIVCRVNSSFIRVGHFELYSRRIRNGTTTLIEPFQAFLLHAAQREGYTISDEGSPTQVLSILRQYMERLTTLIAHWIRVGYCQGNFNSDNCLVGGQTMDYGPFGFIERYDPGWCMWVDGSPHFSFMNQPKAAQANFKTFAESLAPLLQSQFEAQEECEAMVETEFDEVMDNALQDMRSRKLGFLTSTPKATYLWNALERLAIQCPVDYTILWRQLSYFMDDIGKNTTHSHRDIITYISNALYEKLDEAIISKWISWTEEWLKFLGLAMIDTKSDDNRHRAARCAKVMLRNNPKYIPREWMLMEAYQQASTDSSYAEIHRLMKLFTQPYEEGTDEEHKKYYRTRMAGLDQSSSVVHQRVGGITHMTCSS